MIGVCLYKYWNAYKNSKLRSLHQISLSMVTRTGLFVLLNILAVRWATSPLASFNNCWKPVAKLQSSSPNNLSLPTFGFPLVSYIRDFPWIFVHYLNLAPLAAVLVFGTQKVNFTKRWTANTIANHMNSGHHTSLDLPRVAVITIECSPCSPLYYMVYVTSSHGLPRNVSETPRSLLEIWTPDHDTMLKQVILSACMCARLRAAKFKHGASWCIRIVHA